MPSWLKASLTARSSAVRSGSHERSLRAGSLDRPDGVWVSAELGDIDLLSTRKNGRKSVRTGKI